MALNIKWNDTTALCASQQFNIPYDQPGSSRELKVRRHKKILQILSTLQERRFVRDFSKKQSLDKSRSYPMRTPNSGH